MEAPALSARPPLSNVAPVHRGRTRGRHARPRTVRLLLDETISTALPPLASCSGRRGAHVAVPVPGTHARRVRHGVLHIRSGAGLVLVTEPWDQATPHACLTMIRAHWRGWQIVLLEERGAPHPAAASRRLATDVHRALRCLPTAPPALHAMDHRWRQGQGSVLANRPVASMDTAAAQACQALLPMRRRERLRKAGVRSGPCWLTTCAGGEALLRTAIVSKTAVRASPS